MRAFRRRYGSMVWLRSSLPSCSSIQATTSDMRKGVGVSTVITMLLSDLRSAPARLVTDSL